MNLTRRNMIMSAGAAGAMAVTDAEAATMETYYFLVFNSPVPGKENEYLAWYDNRHIIDVTSVPGFVSGQRFIRAEPQMYANIEPRLSTYLTLYTVRTDNLAAVQAEIKKRIETGVTKFEKPTVIQPGASQSYWYRVNAPLIRRTQALAADFGSKTLTSYSHIVFMNAVEGKQKEWEHWYDHTHSPDMLTGAGVMTSQRTTLASPSTAIPAATREMVMFTVQVPEGVPVTSAVPAKRTPMPGGAPTPQDRTSTRGYTYRQIGPVVTHAQAVAKKAAFKD